MIWRSATIRGEMNFVATSSYTPTFQSPTQGGGGGGTTDSRNVTGTTYSYNTSRSSSWSGTAISGVGTNRSTITTTNSGSASGSSSFTNQKTVVRYTSTTRTRTANFVSYSVRTQSLQAVYTTKTKSTNKFDTINFTSTTSNVPTQANFTEPVNTTITITVTGETNSGTTIGNTHDTIYELNTSTNPNRVWLALTTFLYASSWDSQALQIDDYVTTATKYTRSADVKTRNVFTQYDDTPTSSLSVQESSSSLQYEDLEFDESDLTAYYFGNKFPNTGPENEQSFFRFVKYISTLRDTFIFNRTYQHRGNTEPITAFESEYETFTEVSPNPVFTYKAIPFIQRFANKIKSFASTTTFASFPIDTNNQVQAGGAGNTTYINTEPYLGIRYQTTIRELFAFSNYLLCSIASPFGAFLSGQFGKNFTFDGPTFNDGSFFVAVNRGTQETILGLGQLDYFFGYGGIFSLNTSSNKTWTQSGPSFTYRTGSTTESAIAGIDGTKHEDAIIGAKYVFGGKPEKSATFYQRLLRGAYFDQDFNFFTTSGGFTTINPEQNESTAIYFDAPFIWLQGFRGDRDIDYELVEIENCPVLYKDNYNTFIDIGVNP